MKTLGLILSLSKDEATDLCFFSILLERVDPSLSWPPSEAAILGNKLHLFGF